MYFHKRHISPLILILRTVLEWQGCHSRGCCKVVKNLPVILKTTLGKKVMSPFFYFFSALLSVSLFSAKFLLLDPHWQRCRSANFEIKSSHVSRSCISIYWRLDICCGLSRDNCNFYLEILYLAGLKKLKVLCADRKCPGVQIGPGDGVVVKKSPDRPKSNYAEFHALVV